MKETKLKQRNWMKEVQGVNEQANQMIWIKIVSNKELDNKTMKMMIIQMMIISNHHHDMIWNQVKRMSMKIKWFKETNQHSERHKDDDYDDGQHQDNIKMTISKMCISKGI